MVYRRIAVIFLTSIIMFIAIIMIIQLYTALELNYDNDSEWGILCMYFDNGLKLKLYVADTFREQVEGYMFKESIDFEGVGANGMLFINISIIGNSITFTMENVAFNLLLVELIPKDTGSYIVDDIVLMEPNGLYTINTYPGAVFIETEPVYMDRIYKGLRGVLNEC